jgi:hypothetical protein
MAWEIHLLETSQQSINRNNNLKLAHVRFNIFSKNTLLAPRKNFRKDYSRDKQMCAWCQSKLRESRIFNSLLRVQNFCSSSVLVKISASCLLVLTWLRAISSLASWSLKKWCLMSMCVVLEWFTGLLNSLIALSLSHKSGILLNLQPKSLKVNLIQSNCTQQAPATTYSASAVDRAMEFCFFELQDTRDQPRNWQVPDVIFSIYPATGIIRIGIAM